MDALAAGLLSGVSSLVGGLFTNSTNSANTAASNQTNKDITVFNDNFNNTEAVQADNWTRDNMGISQGYAQANMNLANQFNTEAATTAYDRSQAAVKQQQNYLTGMSNTAYQRSVADMRAAGLNPILGVSSGGASTPSSGMAQATAPTMGGASGAMGSGVSASGSPIAAQRPNFQDVISPAISSAMQGAKLVGELELQKRNADNITANTLNTQQDTVNKKEAQPKVTAESIASQVLPDQKVAELGQTRAQTEKIDQDKATSAAQQQLDEANAALARTQKTNQETFGNGAWNNVGTWWNVANTLGRTIDSALANSGKSAIKGNGVQMPDLSVGSSPIVMGKYRDYGGLDTQGFKHFSPSDGIVPLATR